MYACVKQAYRNSAINMKVSISIPYDINLICTKFGTFTVNCVLLVLPVVICQSDASLIIADNCNGLGLILPPAGRSVSAYLISYVNYGGTCKVSNLSLFVTRFRSRVGRFESSTGILSMSVILVSKS